MRGPGVSNPRTETLHARMTRSAALAVVLAWTWASPPPALAQLVGSLVVTVTFPTSGSTVGGTTHVDASVSIIGLLTVQRVQFQLDGANLGAADSGAPYSIPWNTVPASNGTHTLRAVAQDVLGVWWPSPEVTVTVFNDKTPPTVVMTSPTSGATVTGPVTVSANASDNVGVVGVQFQLDGAALGAEDTTAPYAVTWNAATATIGTHTLRAVARDAANNVGTSTSVTVTVPDTAAPTVAMTSPASGATVTGSVTVSANASDNVGVVGVQFQLDGAALGAEDTTPPYAVTWNTATATVGTHTLRAIARDAASNTATSASVSVAVPDTAAPTVAITSPASGATVTGSVTVSADASDNVAVVGVQFQLDGAALGAEDTTAPYAVTWNAATATIGTHTLRAVARDAANNTGTSASVSVTVPDTAAPTVTMTSPASGATVTGSVTVSANASDNVAVVGVQFQLDGAALGVEDTTAPYAVSWDTTTAAPGTHILRAVARDAANNTGTASVTVTVPDTAAPTVGMTSPASGATVTGSVTVSANASDNVGVVGVQFQLDGAGLGAEDTTAPYSVTWDTATAAPGTHTLRAIARDAANNTGTSTSVTVTVSDTVAPTVAMTSPASGATVTGSVTVSANASDNVGVVGVQFQLDGAALGAEDTAAPYAVGWDTTTAAAGTHTLRAVARDAANNTASAAVTVTVSNGAPPDTTAPTVAMTSPASGSTVSGPVAVSANASDDVAVVGVQFQLDGAALGAEDTTAPYSVSWDTTSAVPGSHTLRAIARDAANNTATSAAVTVTVRDVMPPTVAMTSPSSGATVSGGITVTANASDLGGVAGVQFQLDGGALGAEDTAAPYSVTWDTATAADGSHSLRAVARDGAGNTSTSASVAVTVSNSAPDTTAPTVSLSSPASGATVTGTITVTADASDNVGVAAVRFQLDGASLGAEDTTAPYSVSWNTSTATAGTHTLSAIARDAANNTGTSAAVTVTVSNNGFGPGDVFVALLGGTVQWHNADGSFRQNLPAYGNGQISSLGFDSAGNLYAPNWYGTIAPPGNTVARFDPSGNLLGAFGSGYNANPGSVTFDAQGNVYVGQSDGTGDILKFDPAGNLLATFDVAVGSKGTDHIDLGPDGCTMFYTSRTKDVYRYNVCTNTQLPFFNTQPLPGYEAYHMRALPDGGVLVADTSVIVRLDSSGNQIQTYFAPGENNYWGGVDLVGDGTFWGSNASTGNIFKFDLQSGAILGSFNPGTGSPAGVGVKPIRP